MKPILRAALLLLLLLGAFGARAQCASATTNLQVSAITATTATLTFNGGISICGGTTIRYAYAGSGPVSVAYAMPLLLTGLPPATAITVSVVRRAPNGLGGGPSCLTCSAATLTFTTAAPLPVAAALGGTSSLTLAPNPARTSATLTLASPQTGSTLVQVVDALSREVRHLPLPARATTAVLDLAGLPPGLYLVRAGTATTRLVVE